MYLNFKLSSTHYLENRTLRKLNRKKNTNLKCLVSVYNIIICLILQQQLKLKEVECHNILGSLERAQKKKPR